MVPQTLEERRAALEKRNQKNKQNGQMSSSSGSPALRRRSVRMTGGIKMTGSAAEDKKTGERVSSIRQYFETKAGTSPPTSGVEMTSNNNSVCNTKCTMICSEEGSSPNLNQRAEMKGVGHLVEKTTSE